MNSVLNFIDLKMHPICIINIIHCNHKVTSESEIIFTAEK